MIPELEEARDAMIGFLVDDIMQLGSFDRSEASGIASVAIDSVLANVPDSMRHDTGAFAHAVYRKALQMVRDKAVRDALFAPET